MDKEVLASERTPAMESPQGAECPTARALLRTSCYDLTGLAAAVQTSDVLQDKRRQKRADTRPHVFAHAQA